METAPVLGQISKALPSTMNPNRLVRQAITLAQSNPDILRCSQLSIIAGIMQAAQLGLELSGPLGHAYLVPRKNKRSGLMEVAFQIGWKGLVALAFRSGLISSFPVRTVYERDQFSIMLGTNQEISHTPYLGPDGRGKPIGHYALVKYITGGSDFEYMTIEQIEAHRQRYGGSGRAWQDSRESMEQKTVVRQLCRRLSLCPEAQNQAVREEYEEAGVPVVLPLEVEESSREMLILDQPSQPQAFDGGPDPLNDPVAPKDKEAKEEKARK